MFRTKIASLIATSFDISFWAYGLLQIADAFKTVQNAVVVLVAAYQTHILESDANPAQCQSVLTQYNKSINSLRQYLGKTKFRTETQQVVVLITTYFAYLSLRHSRGSVGSMRSSSKRSLFNS
ncbi:hypothetical protein N7532_004963 [Penicillium argentinense]|uniref:Uncharacterized protein n=1 Tax=Penicillium argentinense TaxID=1131581 RepID=A0A9W9FD41_9EURO|nr:uncharacterized protein N7532_004963 [Penicillium argentinense]KAJ5097962.1 hypothetical protein N7532_004963 [Penicillium argentinense]